MFTPDQRTKIAAALNSKNIKPCPSCGRVGTFVVGDALVVFPLQPNVSHGISVGGPSYPGIPVTCNYCGFMAFYNVFTLGLADDLGLKIPVAVQRPG